MEGRFSLGTVWLFLEVGVLYPQNSPVPKSRGPLPWVPLKAALRKFCEGAEIVHVGLNYALLGPSLEMGIVRKGVLEALHGAGSKLGLLLW